MPTPHINVLMSKHNALCHYCNAKTARATKLSGLKTATKDHVLPRAFGGEDKLSNYVLACSDCNSRRGTNLFMCRCDFCADIIDNALKDPKVVDVIFNGMLQSNRVKVFKQKDVWVARRGYVHRSFDSQAEAMDYANNGTFEKGR